MGAINLKHNGSGSDITLSSDGTDLLLDGTAIGGGGGSPDLFADNDVSATAPTASGDNSVAIGNDAQATSTNSIAIGSTYNGSGARATTGTGAIAIGGSRATGTESFAAMIGSNSSSGAQGTNSVAIGFGANATNTSSHAIGSNTTSSGYGSLAIGREAYSIADRSTAITNSYASGSAAFAAAITNNTSSYGATGSNSVAIGRLAKATGSHSLAIGGYNNFAAGAAAVSIGGNQANKAFGNASFCIGGWQAWNEATDDNSFAMGEGAKSAVKGKLAYAGGRFNIIGDAQGGQFILRADTTDATATALTTNNSTAGSTNQIVAASDTCITFDGTITAMQNGAQAYASWKIEGLLVNDGGTTTLANSATTAISNADGWGMALSADNTNNALAITVTGEASHNILWVANIRTTEVTYA